MEEAFEHGGSALGPLVVVDVAVLGTHPVDVCGVGGRVGTQDRQVGIEQHGGVVTDRLRCRGGVFGRLDHRPDAVDRIVGPPERCEVAPGQAGTRPLVGRVRRLVHGVVVERGRDDLVEMVDRLVGRQLVDMADHPGDMGGGVVSPVLLTVTGEESVEQPAVVGDVELPGDLQLEISFAHRASVPSVVAG